MLRDTFLRYTLLRTPFVGASVKALFPRSEARYVRKTSSLTWVLSLTLLAASMGVSGCSKKGSGSIDGEGADGSISETDLNAQREGRFGSGSIPVAEGEGLFRDIRFDYDSAAVDEQAHQDLTSNAAVLERDPQIRVTLEGHCDERGTVEYNMALGSERARAVKSALISLGVSSSRIDTISYGEEVPLDQGHDEQAFSQNRRVHFSAGTGSISKGKGSQY